MTSVPAFSVRNPVVVHLLTWLLVASGAYVGWNLTREFFPATDPDQITVNVPFPGATAEEIERSVTRRIEREVEDVDGVEKVESRIFEGSSITILSLEDRVEREVVLGDVRSAVDRATPDLPIDAEEPSVALQRPSMPVISVAVHGDVPEERLGEVARDVRDDLRTIPGVSLVAVSGLREQEIVVEVSPERLEQFELDLGEISRVVAAGNVELSGGVVESALGNVGIRTMGETLDVQEIANRVLATGPEHGVVRLRDVADVRLEFEDRARSSRFGGQPAVTMVIFKSPEDDALDISRAVKEYVASQPERLGGSIHLTTTTDVSRFIQQRIDLMVRNGAWGLLFVALTLVCFLHPRVAFWVAFGLPISFLGAFLVMQQIGATINMISLFGLIVVLGLIVDDAIVVGENIYTRIQQGIPPLRAAQQGAEEVALPVTATVITTIAAFAPLAFLDGAVGTFMRQLPLVVIAALGVSLIEALLILPCHLGHTRVAATSPGRTSALRGFLERLHAWRTELLEHRLQRIYRHHLDVALRGRYIVHCLVIALLALTAGLIGSGVVPFVLIQSADAETLMVDLEMAAGTSEDITLTRLEELEALARTQPEVERVITTLGSLMDDQGRDQASDPATAGQLTVELVPAEERQDRGLRKSEEVIAALRATIGSVEGATTLRVRAREAGPVGPDIELRIRADDPEQLPDLVAHVREDVASYRGVSEIDDDFDVGKVELRLTLRDDARLLGLSTRDLARQLRAAFFGEEAQRLQADDQEIKVRVRLPEDARQDLAVLGRLRVVTPQGARVPLEEVAELTTARGPSTIVRVDGDRTVTLTADVDEAHGNSTEINADLVRRFAGIGTAFPGARITAEGSRKEMMDSFASLKVGFPIALFLIYSIIAVLFRSYLQPLLVMAAIPVAFLGAVWGHWIMGLPFTLLSLIGGVALTGIVVNDSLILVDFINRLRRQGHDLEAAVRAGGQARLRAILLTTITTCAGLGPLMTERSFQAQFLIPMAVSIVFGLAMATGLILLYVPVLYRTLEDLRAAWRWAFEIETSPEDSVEPGRQLA